MKTLVWGGMFIGSAIGSYIPALWGDGFLSIASILFSGAGAILGIWAGYQLSQFLDL